MINANKGMYIEQLIDRTIEYFNLHCICHLEKRQIPITILKKINENTVLAKIKSKSYVDYFGYINKCFVEIEVKQTQRDFFDFNLIKSHQLEYLLKCSEFGIVPYLLVHFEFNNTILIIKFAKIYDWYLENKRKKISYLTFSQLANKIEITFPGIIRIDLVIK